MTFSLWFLFIVNIFFLSTLALYAVRYQGNLPGDLLDNRPGSPLLNLWLRHYWFWFTEPLVQFCIRKKISPNQLTITGTILGGFSGLCFAQGNLGLAGWFLIAGATFDIFDGRVARLTHNNSKAGAYFDSLMDRVSEGLAFMGLAFYYRNNPLIFLIVLIGFMGSFLVSYSRARGAFAGVDCESGWMQRPERIVYLGVGAIFAPLLSWGLLALHLVHPETPVLAHQLYVVPLLIVAIFTWATVWTRSSKIMKSL